MDETGHAHFGRCPCGGSYEHKWVQVTFRAESGTLPLNDVSQGACPDCGSRVYKCSVLRELEAVMPGKDRADNSS